MAGILHLDKDDDREQSVFNCGKAMLNASLKYGDAAFENAICRLFALHLACLSRVDRRKTLEVVKSWIKDISKEEHHKAELLRLRAGFPGCGCSDCQELYRKLDLSKYKDRVIKLDDYICTKEGRAGADLWDKYQQPSYWSGNGQLFITGGKKYGLTPKLKIVCFGAITELPPNNDETQQNEKIGVAKIPPKGITMALPKKRGIMQHPPKVKRDKQGRPPKEGKVHRVTVWRREKQGSLF